MFEIILLAMGGGALWLFLHFRAVNERTLRYNLLAEQFDLDQAESKFNESCALIVEHFRRSPASPFSEKFIADQVECAVACQERINNIKGLPSGPTFRIGFRTHLLSTLAKVAGT